MLGFSVVPPGRAPRGVTHRRTWYANSLDSTFHVVQVVSSHLNEAAKTSSSQASPFRPPRLPKQRATCPVGPLLNARLSLSRPIQPLLLVSTRSFTPKWRAIS